MNRSILGQVFTWLVTAYQKRQAIHRLSNLDDHLLRDMGIERSEIFDAVHHGVPPMDLPVGRPSAGRPELGLRLDTSRARL